MRLLLVLLHKEIIEQSRTRKLLILALVFAFLGLASPITAKLLPELFKNLGGGVVIKIPKPTYLDAIDQFVKNASQLVLYILVFVVSGSVVDEKVKKTLEMVLSKPVPRSSFILAKFLGWYRSVGLYFLASSLLCYFYTLSIFGSFAFLNFLWVSLLLLLFILVVLSVTILASTLARSMAAAGIVGFASTFILSYLLSVIPAVKDYAPGFILGHYREVMKSGPSTDFLGPTVVSLLIIALCITAAIYAFSRQEVER